MEQQGAVRPQAFQQAALPACSLALQHRQALGCLRPTHRIGQKDNAIGLCRHAVAQVQPDDQFHVLANRGHAVAARLDHGPAIEDAEGTRDDHECVHRRPTQAPEQKRPQVLDDLHPCQQAARHAHALQEPARDTAAVGNANRAAADDHRGIFEKRANDSAQAVGAQDGVGIHRAEQRVARAVDAGVERIGLAAVFLVDDAKVGVPG